MTKKSTNAKEKIREAAWQLFLTQSYEETSLDEILRAAETSRSNFYHHYRSKEDILFQMAYYFDQTYTDWLDTIDPDLPTADKLIAFDLFCSRAVEDSSFRPFLDQLYGLEVMTKGERYILLENRQFYQTVLKLFLDGQKRGDISREKSANDLAHIFAGLQRGIVYNWLLEGCQYSLSERCHIHMKLFMDSLRV